MTPDTGWTVGPDQTLRWDEREPLFPSQQCGGCPGEHPGQPCPEPDLFSETQEER